MEGRRPSGMLAIVLPRPSLPRKRSSLLATSSPRTPRSSASPSFYFTANRKSSDSWNSSNIDITIEEKESDWSPEQTLLLSRTLDALPAHLITPFVGHAIPPNLIAKIAASVSQAKGATEWPHSLRATRSKIIELVRQRAREEKCSQENMAVCEDEQSTRSPYSGGDVFQQSTNIGVFGNRAQPKRPLYRQSSMDFMSVSPRQPDIKDNDSIHRLSKRLQRTDRIINPSYHPYSRGSDGVSRPSSPQFHSLSKPSTSTLSSSSNQTTSSSYSSCRGMLRRSASTLTSVSNSSSIGAMAVDNRHPLSALSYLEPGLVVTDRLSDSFCAPVLAADIPKRSAKRAPSFGHLAQESRKDSALLSHVAMRPSKFISETPSSDEEEKTRARGAKKMRTKSSIASLSGSEGAIASSPPASVPCTPASVPKPKVKIPTAASPTPAIRKRPVLSSISTENMPVPALRSRANAHRNPSIFGAELPHSKMLRTPPATEIASPSSSLASTPELVASTPKRKTLRRVRRLAPGRKLSFGEALGGNDADGEDDHEDFARVPLGSAFKLV